jgi:peptide/nickel transport system substrate-binding protein
VAVRAQTLEFGILGPFEVKEDGKPLGVGGGKQRALLAVLVLHAGEVVSTDRLIDAVWGERPPASASNSVHIYVSRLRKLLGNDRLETRGHGYRLSVDSEQLDLARFERLLGEGRTLLATGDPAAAAEKLREALALWRGPPLTDFASEPFAQSEIARLEELRVAAHEERVEADLALGRDAELVPELEALVHEHPLRERLRAQLMLALYRSGRQAEALATYREARRTLHDELGLEPGRRLQELEQAILQQQPELDCPPRAPGTARPSHRVGLLVAVGATILLGAAIAVAGREVAGSDSSGLERVSANAVAAIDTGSNRLVSDVPVGNGPTSVAADESSVWVTNAHEGSVSHLDPGTGRTVQRVDVGGDPGGLDIGAGAVWVANSLDATVSRIDPRSNRVVQTIPVGLTPLAVAVDGTSVWVTNAGDRSISRVDAAHGRVVDRFPTGAVGRGIAAGAGAVWITNESDGNVVRIDARRGRVVGTVGVGSGPTGIAFADGAVWVANSLDGTVSRIDAATNRVTATIPVGEGPDSIAVGEDAVWVSGELAEQVVRIDPSKNRVVRRIPIANRPRGLAVSGDRLWLAVQASGAGHRGGRLVSGGGGAIQGSIDPSYMSWAGTWSSLGHAYDGLVGYVRRGGSEGTRLVPNLAESLPAITGGGTSYAFRLRRGIRYSDGTSLRASDFRRTVERMSDLTFPPLVGLAACKRQPRTCDFSRAIRTDDAAWTIVFRLRRPDDDFLRWLSTLWPVPRGTPSRDVGTRPVPSTGPYMIERYVPGRVLAFVRNPFFRVWSEAAQPDGFPNEIVLRLGDLNESFVTAVERGRVDIAGAPVERPEDVELFESFRARFPSRVHGRAVRATVLLFLNTTQPPFDDVRVRRAVNYAVDRAAIARAYGGLTVPTCQLRPPGTVGFRSYCPYTAAPNAAGEWRAPDLARARSLVAASGTRGTPVTVWTYGKYPNGFWEQALQASVRTLKSLGYRARIRRARNLDDYVAKTTDERTRGVQAGVIGWYGPPPKASSLLDAFRCNPPDWSFFCNRRIDNRIDRAFEVEATDPDAATVLWEGIERDIVDLAPWVPLFTPGHASVVSRRVGNYQLNPELGLLLDQLWVR